MVTNTLMPFVGGHLAKRFYDEPKHVELPAWSYPIVLVDLLVILVPIIWMNYTLGKLLPAMTVIEDPQPPAYEPLASNEDIEAVGAPAGQNKNAPVLPGANGKPITSSVRATHRLLRSVGGFKGLFRGFMAALTYTISMAVADSFFSGLVSFAGVLHIGSLLASLALVQLDTAWVHIIMTPPNPSSFWRRLPPFRRTFEATCFPVFVRWVALTGAASLPIITASALGLQMWSPKDPNEVPKYDARDAGKFLIVWLVTVAAHLFFVLPSLVGLIRVQASLLSPEEPTIIPFDSTFQGKVAPAVVDGKGYVTLRDAISTFTRASWIRLLKLYVKTFFVSLAVFFAVFAFLGVQMALLGLKAPSNPPQ